MSTVTVEPQEAGALVALLGDGYGIASMFHRDRDGVWIDDDGFEYTWPEIEHAARAGQYVIRPVERVIAA